MSFEQFCFQHKFQVYKDLLWVFAPWKRIVLRKRKTTPAYRFIVLHCLTFSDLQQHSNIKVCLPASQVLQLVCNRLIWVKKQIGMVTFIICWHVSDGGSGFRCRCLAPVAISHTMSRKYTGSTHQKSNYMYSHASTVHKS